MEAMGVSEAVPSWSSIRRRTRLSTMHTSYPFWDRCSAVAHPQ